MADQVLGAFASERDRRAGSITVTLPATGASDSVDIRGFANITLQFSSTIASANIDVETSFDNTTFGDLYTRDKTKVTFAAPDGLCFDVPELSGASYVRFGVDADDSANNVVVMGKV